MTGRQLYIRLLTECIQATDNLSKANSLSVGKHNQYLIYSIHGFTAERACTPILLVTVDSMPLQNRSTPIAPPPMTNNIEYHFWCPCRVGSSLNNCLVTDAEKEYIISLGAAGALVGTIIACFMSDKYRLRLAA